MCERRRVRITCHNAPHGEAVELCLRPFYTISEGEFSEVRCSI